ncbi:metal ABC transporter permease [Bartonella sp. DGB1]|uniref:metal ABC transporter permease n=1 Tax=Bartonella sp. DGB1 TaxID=3239807 RepID=UPI0035261DEA
MQKYLDILLELFSYPFMQRALIISIIIGICCAIISCFLILKGWAMIGDAISHSVLPGLAVAHILAIPAALGAFLSALLCTVTLGYVKNNSKLKEDTILGIILSVFFALGIVLISLTSKDQHMLHILFGNILGITNIDFFQTIITAVFTLMVLLLKYKDFMLLCFDDVQANSIGLPVKLMNNILLILLALTIVSGMKTAGVILIIAMVIIPGIIALMLCRNFPSMLIISVMSSVFASVTGLIISYFADIPTGAVIVGILSMIFVAAIAIKFTRNIINNFK